MRLSKYSLGVGDRFSHAGEAQLKALKRAEEEGVLITPVWNKSNREHAIIGTLPIHTRLEADEAVQALDWNHDYHVDADHINRGNLGKFLIHCDFFTIDVAEFIESDLVGICEEEIEAFALSLGAYAGDLFLEGLESPLTLTYEGIHESAKRYYPAIKEAAAIYRIIEREKGADSFITEISLDETDRPQMPADLFVILAALAREEIPAQTIAPRFTGHFPKGVEYEGDAEAFAREFEADLAVISFAVREFSLADNLKLSIHSGSDKFAVYGAMNRAIRKFDAGLHVKTSGTTWLEEAIALCESGGEGYGLIREIYREALGRYDELVSLYRDVSLDLARLPRPDEVDRWEGERFARALRHDRSCPDYDPRLRQLMHISYKLAAERGKRFYPLLERVKEASGRNVEENLYERHIRRLFFPQ